MYIEKQTNKIKNCIKYKAATNRVTYIRMWSKLSNHVGRANSLLENPQGGIIGLIMGTSHAHNICVCVQEH